MVLDTFAVEVELDPPDFDFPRADFSPRRRLYELEAGGHVRRMEVTPHFTVAGALAVIEEITAR